MARRTRRSRPDGDGCWFCMNGRAKKHVLREREADRDMKQQLEEEDEPDRIWR